MIKRTASSIVIVLTVIAFFLLRTVNYKLFDILVYGIAILCTIELLRAYKDDVSKLQKALVLLFTLTVFPIMSLLPQFIIQYVTAYVSVLIFVCVLTTALDKNDGLFKVIFATFYPTIPLLSMILLNLEGGDGVYFLLTALTIPAFTDVGAYLLGSTIKGPKLCPNISPNKTVSGAVGGLICGIIATLSTYFGLKLLEINVFSGMNIVNVVIFLITSGIFLSVIAQIGDLVESYIKRRLNIKDMGSLIPGHGGMLDRVDGLAFTSLFTFVLYSIVL